MFGLELLFPEEEEQGKYSRVWYPILCVVLSQSIVRNQFSAAHTETYIKHKNFNYVVEHYKNSIKQ